MQAASGSASPLQGKISVERLATLEGVGRGIEIKKDDGDESDADARIVPEFSGRLSNARAAPTKPQCGASTSKRRGAGPQEKEHKRMKRLLRNRVSAQQARERKKAYLLELEMKTKDLEQRNAELEERVSTLQRENFMLRQIVKNTTIKNNIVTTVGPSGMEA